MTVYDPETLRAVKVPVDDPRATDFLTRAEATAERREQRKRKKAVEDVVEKAVERTLTSEAAANVGRQVRDRAARAGTAAAGTLRTAVSLGTGGAAAGVATLGVAGTAAAAAVAFGIGYGIGKLALAAVKYMSAEEVQARRNRDLRKARREYELKVGRPVNRAEAKAMAQGWAQASGITLNP